MDITSTTSTSFSSGLTLKDLEAGVKMIEKMPPPKPLRFKTRKDFENFCVVYGLHPSSEQNLFIWGTPIIIEEEL